MAVTQENFLAMSGSAAIYCIRTTLGFKQWQLDTCDAIVAAYLKLKMDYDQAVAESDISSTTPVEGSNPGGNNTIVADELKKLYIEFMTAQSFDTFGSVEMDQSVGIPEVHDFR